MTFLGYTGTGGNSDCKTVTDIVKKNIDTIRPSINGVDIA
jgi:hypothetical protein